MSDDQTNRSAQDICGAFDVPVWLIVGGKRPQFHRIRWAMRRITRYRGEARREQ